MHKKERKKTEKNSWKAKKLKGQYKHIHRKQTTQSKIKTSAQLNEKKIANKKTKKNTWKSYLLRKVNGKEKNSTQHTNSQQQHHLNGNASKTIKFVIKQNGIQSRIFL